MSVYKIKDKINKEYMLTILFFSWVLRDGALSRWAGTGVLDWPQPVGLWFGELPATGAEIEKLIIINTHFIQSAKDYI